MKECFVQELSPAPAPTDVCAALEGLPYRIFFDSAGPPEKYARYSFVAADPDRVIISKQGQARITSRNGEVEHSDLNPLLVLRTFLKDSVTARDESLPPFQGGAAGYIGYEFGSALEGVTAPADDLEIPDLCIGIYDTVFAWDHAAGKAWLISESLDRQALFLAAIQSSAHSGNPSAAAPNRRSISSSLSRDEYRTAIERIREYIAAGDIFQANFAQRFQAPLTVSPWNLYVALRAHNPAPFACYFEAGESTVMSASPERFIRVDALGIAETRPIKGTRPRLRTAGEDAGSADELVASVKDNAEHVMIVDVLRNDFSRVCVPGSVLVSELAALESHPTVHHLVSTVKGQLRNECDSIDLLRASMPGGSITGAPKIRAMEIIAELEPVRRDVYCGCMCYLTADGTMDSSIVIRTFLAKDDRVYFSAGGGIVADSEPDLEFEETLHKAAGLVSALESIT